MTQIKMRPRPDQERLPQQSAFMARLVKLRSDGLGWEDIHVILRRENMPAPADHIRNFVLRPRS